MFSVFATATLFAVILLAAAEYKKRSLLDVLDELWEHPTFESMFLADRHGPGESKCCPPKVFQFKELIPEIDFTVWIYYDANNTRIASHSPNLQGACETDNDLFHKNDTKDVYRFNSESRKCIHSVERRSFLDSCLPQCHHLLLKGRSVAHHGQRSGRCG